MSCLPLWNCQLVVFASYAQYIHALGKLRRGKGTFVLQLLFVDSLAR